MDPFLDRQAQRLIISSVLTAQVRRQLGRCVDPGTASEELLDLARGLGEGTDAIERAYHLHFEPSYPGVTAGPQPAGDAWRLLLACVTHDSDGHALGVAYTVLISGRPPQVSMAPAEASIPEGWRQLAEFH